MVMIVMTILRANVVVVVVVVGDVFELDSVHCGESVARRRLGKRRFSSNGVQLAAPPHGVVIILDVLQVPYVQFMLVMMLSS